MTQITGSSKFPSYSMLRVDKARHLYITQKFSQDDPFEIKVTTNQEKLITPLAAKYNQRSMFAKGMISPQTKAVIEDLVDRILVIPDLDTNDAKFNEMAKLVNQFVMAKGPEAKEKVFDAIKSFLDPFSTTYAEDFDVSIACIGEDLDILDDESPSPHFSHTNIREQNKESEKKTNYVDIAKLDLGINEDFYVSNKVSQNTLNKSFYNLWEENLGIK